RAGRIRHGDVPDARGRGRWAARIYVVSLLERTAVVLVGNPALCLGAGTDCDGAGAAGAGVWLVCLSLKNQRRLFLDHDAGADLRGDVAVLSQRNRVWWQ